ncbi:YciI-like protein [Massilia sp. METH4]|uniref:YciI-like protein n=1 Tax=Massilia sp. METH4 TaxID=3123041 RepID=UPI0030D2737F
MHYLLTYELADGYLERRAEFRDEHLKLAWNAVERGELLLAGAAGDPPDVAQLVFTIDSPAIAESFAAADPYVKHGLVKRWTVRKWHTVVGELASSPVR